MDRIPIAVQLYSVREDCEKDLPGVLQAVFDMGYDGVEFAGYYGYDAGTLKSMLDDLGLRVAGTHTALSTLLADELEQTVEFNHTLGNKFLIVPGLPQQRCNSKDAWLETADLFNDISARLEPHGMYTGYHNHGVEFQQFDGATGWNIFFKQTDERVVMQIDTANAMHAGADPVPYVQRYKGRALTVHLKEYSSTQQAPMVGEGEVPWKKFFDACERIGGTQWYIVEQESYRYPPLQCIAECLNNLEKMGK